MSERLLCVRVRSANRDDDEVRNGDRLAKIEIVQVLDACVLKQHRGKDVDPLRYLGPSITQELSAE